MSFQIGDTVKIKGPDPKIYTIIGVKGLLFQLHTAVNGSAIEIRRANELELVSRIKKLSSFSDASRPNRND
jgi:hypothetical protein